MNIGKYMLERMNSGKWAVQWTDPNTRYRNHVIIDDLEAIFDNIIKTPHDMKKMELVSLFRSAFLDEKSFWENPMCHDILKHLPNTTVFPGYLPTSEKRYEWHLTQFIEAYASLTGVRFSPTELEPYLYDLIWKF